MLKNKLILSRKDAIDLIRAKKQDALAYEEEPSLKKTGQIPYLFQNAAQILWVEAGLALTEPLYLVFDRQTLEFYLTECNPFE